MDLNPTIKRSKLQKDWICKQDPSLFYTQDTHLNINDRHQLKVKG